MNKIILYQLLICIIIAIAILASCNSIAKLKQSIGTEVEISAQTPLLESLPSSDSIAPVQTIHSIDLYLTQETATSLSVAKKLTKIKPADINAIETSYQKNGTGWLVPFNETKELNTLSAQAPSPNGKGYILDDETLTGKAIPAGTWKASIVGKVVRGKAIADIHVRVFKYANDNYTPIAELSKTGVNLVANKGTTATMEAEVEGLTLNEGEKLYYDFVYHIKENDGSDSLKYNFGISLTIPAIAGEGTVLTTRKHTPSSTATAMATFESIGIYWSPIDGSTENICSAQYRQLGTKAWKDALELWYDEKTPEYRGSIIGLTPDTSYEIKLSLKNGISQTITTKTWCENFPIAKTTYLPELTKSMVAISDSGTADGYHLVTSNAGKTATIDVAGKDVANMVVNASYVIVRGLTISNGKRHGIVLGPNAHHVVIEECDISGWGEIKPDGWGAAKNNAIHSESSALHKIVVQRNKIHHPRSNSNNWSQPRPSYNNDPHPEGPQAVSFYNDNEGNNVIRYNEIFSDFEHMFNDGIGGGPNFSNGGFPGPDSDIYGNIITHAWDNPIEVEGGGVNVRVWGNYIDSSRTAIASVPVSIGPIYIFRNVTNKYYADHTSEPDTVTKFLKGGSGASKKDEKKVRFGDGRIYLFHNTLLQEPGVNGEDLGCAVGIGSVGTLTNIISRNNIFYVSSPNNFSLEDSYRKDSGLPVNDFDYDLYNGQIKSAIFHEVNGIKGVPIFDPSNGNMYDPFKGPMKFALSPGSKGYDAGVVIKNFNDNFTGKAPDIGVFEADTQPMEFGVNAYRYKR